MIELNRNNGRWRQGIRVLGIDPGYAIVGYGVLDHVGNSFRVADYGAITTQPSTPYTERLAIIWSELNDIIKKYEPDSLAVEEIFFTTNQKTAIKVAQARGIILLAGVEYGLSVGEYTPLQIKQAVTGYGKADKNQVQQMTKSILGLSAVPKPDDTADALAVAICHAHSARSYLNLEKYGR